MKRGGQLRRGAPLQRGKPLERGDSTLERGGPIAKRSKARTKQMKEHRVPLVQELISDGVGCAICPELDRRGIPHPPCRGIEGLHERRKSSSGGSRLIEANLVPACNWANGILIEDGIVLDGEYVTARDLFGTWLVLRQGDPEWDRMSKRWDRLGGPPDLTDED